MSSQPVEKQMMDFIVRLAQQPRPPGSPGSEQGRVLIRQLLEEKGYSVSEHKGTVPDWRLVGHPYLEMIFPERRDFPALPAIFSPPTPPEGIIGHAARAEDLTMLDSFSWSRMALFDDHDTPQAFIISNDKDVRVQPLAESAQDAPYVIVSHAVFSELST